MPPPASRVYAAVYMTRGSVAGSNRGTYGAFVRDGTDTAWTKLNRSNVICFGLAYAPHGPLGTLYIAGGNGVHRSTDGGQTWKILTGWRTEEISSIVPDAGDPGLLLAATPFGVFRSNDGGETWLPKNSGLKRWYIRRLFPDARNHKTLYALAEDDLYRSLDGGEQWLPMRAGAGLPVSFAQDPVRGQVMLLGSENDGVRRSIDGGRTWEAVESFAGRTVLSFRFAESDSVVYAGGYGTGLWRSVDGGLRWERLPFTVEHEGISAMYIDPGNADHLIVGTHGHGVYESTDRGERWKFAGLRGGIIKQIERFP